MIDTSVISILTFFLILGDLEAVTVVSHHSDDEYVLEHEVLRKNALIEAKKLEIHPGPIPGCKPCTNPEMTYCIDGSVINDHCCCDGNFNSRCPTLDCFPSSSIPVASGQKHARYTLEIARNTRDCENAAAIRIWPPSGSIWQLVRDHVPI